MANIYNSLKNVFQDLKKENNQNPLFVYLLLVLVTIPLGYAVNNIVLGLLAIMAILKFDKTNFKIEKNLMLPIIFYILMLLSYLWSIDQKSTLKSLPKEIPLLIIPLIFLMMKNLTKNQKDKIIKYYSFGILLLTIFWLFKAFVRYLITKDSTVFFYHELVTKDLNAIHVSVYVSIAFFYFFIKENKVLFEKIASALLFVFVILLSSKNIILIFILLILIQSFFYSKMAHRLRLRNLTIMLMAIGFLLMFGKIKERFAVEFRTNSSQSISHNLELNKKEGLSNVSIADAWTKDKFHPSDYFPGTAFRAYQLRMFIELFKEEPVFWKGFGVNASKVRLLEKEKKYNLHSGYGNYNFHNQYVQAFAELGVFGFMLLLIMLFVTFKKSIKTKDFIHISFAILMISLFLTESFLWRQRGVMFFTLMYCLFNSSVYEEIAIKKNKLS